jgi:hypothetical protein
MDSGGNMAADVTIDGTSLYIFGGVLQVQPLGITNGLINNLAVDQYKIKLRTSASTGATVGNVLVTASSTTAYTINQFFVVANGATGTLTTNGNPVQVSIVPDGNGSGSTPSRVFMSSNASSGYVGIFRDSTLVAQWYINNTPGIPVSFTTLDFPAAGTYTYSAQILSATGAASINLQYSKLVAYEIK